jgi:hypothetical protein
MSCANQFFKFYKQGEAKFRHTATLAEKIKTIPYLIETALNESLRQVKVYNLLADVDVAERLVHEMVKEVLGYDREITSMDVLSKKSTRAINTMDKLYANIQREMAQKGQNLWGLHSGITRFSTHEMSAPNRDNGRIESGLIGNGYLLNQKSLKFAMNQANVLEFA